MSEPSPLSDPKRWMAAWRLAGADLERIRQSELRRVDTGQAVRALAGAFLYARRHFPPEPTSGLVEQQRWFARLR